MIDFIHILNQFLLFELSALILIRKVLEMLGVL